MNSKKKTWENILSKGVLPNIQKWNDYETAYIRGQIRAAKFLSETGDLWSKKTLFDTHKLLFGEIHPWAGEESRHQEIIGGIACSPPGLRAFEFQLLEAQMDLIGESLADTTTGKLRAAAFHHGRILLIHPFHDGNGRVARLILTQQLERLTRNVRPSQAVAIPGEKSGYIDALRALQQPAQANLAPLSNLFHQWATGQQEPAKFVPVPFRMASNQFPPPQPENSLDDSIWEPVETLNEAIPQRASWLARIRWDTVKALCGGTPQKSLPKVERLWGENRHTRFTPSELIQFLQKLEEMEPWAKPAGVLRRPKGTSWDPVIAQILAPWPDKTDGLQSLPKPNPLE